METRRKVFAYITRGREVLVFRHVYHPDAGLQVPAGTLEAGESPESGVLGEQVRDMRDFGTEAWHHRYFFHLTSSDELPDHWRHAEPEGRALHDGKPIQFDFFWANINAVPTLTADYDRFIPELRDRLPTDSKGLVAAP